MERRPQTQEVKQNEKTENLQQMKEQIKNPQDQTNEEEIGSLPEKQFRAMIIKMIQNLRMEAQTNRMDAWIEKIQEMFNKDLEIMNRRNNEQSAMSNTITEIKITLEKTNSRITEAEE